MSAGLLARVRVARDDFVLDVDIVARPGRVTAILGPNGSGKTTLMGSIAGMQAVDSGTITLDGVTVDDAANGVFTQARDRRIGMVFQDLLLFGHLNVLDNVAFGPRSRGQSRHDSRITARTWLDRLGIADLADRRPASLSGGQAQRVAMARALAVEPALLLLDEPLAALDAGTRQDVRGALSTHLAGFPGTTLLVTHDPLDALILADDVIVMESGRVSQQGTIDEVAARPQSAYVAALVGVNLLRGHAASGQVMAEDGSRIAIPDHALSGDAVVVIRPEAISLHRDRPEGSARNVWWVTVTSIEPGLERVLVRVAGPPDLVVAVTPAALAELALAPGSRVFASAKALDLDAYGRH